MINKFDLYVKNNSKKRRYEIFFKFFFFFFFCKYEIIFKLIPATCFKKLGTWQFKTNSFISKHGLKLVAANASKGSENREKSPCAKGKAKNHNWMCMTLNPTDGTVLKNSMFLWWFLHMGSEILRQNVVRKHCLLMLPQMPVKTALHTVEVLI